MVWGGRRLATSLAKPLATDEPHGESWEVSDHPLHRSVVATGPHAGRSLRELMEQHRTALLGLASHATFPWLIKFLDAHDWLSVQVHPDTESVKHLWPGEGSKTEAWFVLHALPGSRIFAGLRPGVDERRLRAALEQGGVADCLHSFAPQAGDCIFLPAGTVHAVGGGVLIAEVQQTSDATFRLFDWDRVDAQGQRRTLHIEEGMACIDWGQGPAQPVRASANMARQELVHCSFFTLEHLGGTAPHTLGSVGALQALVVLRGRGQLHGPDGTEELRPGDVRLLPATMAEVRLEPTAEFGALLATLPE
jgi:mannose-6-phosphate isomerase